MLILLVMLLLMGVVVWLEVMELFLMGDVIDLPTPAVEDDVDELPDSEFTKSATGVFDKTDNGKAGVLPSS